MFDMTVREVSEGLAETQTVIVPVGIPELVKMDQAQLDEPEALKMLRDDPDAYAKRVKSLDSRFVVPRIVQDERIKIGVMGDYAGASADLGRIIATECVDALTGLIRELEDVRDHG